jgi:hypothetical protein
VRQAAFEQCGGFDPALTISEDWDVWRDWRRWAISS